MILLRRNRRRLADDSEIRMWIDMPSDVDPADIARQIHFAMGGRVPRPEPEAAMVEPTVGSIVHYVSYGTPGGEYPSVCRAAIVTAVPPDDAVSLCVLNPEGMYFNQGVLYAEGRETPGDPECPNREQHGSPFRYCGCGWIEASHRGGTWHWPERV